MLIGEMRGSFPKITSEENRSIWRKIPTGFSIQMESALDFEIIGVIQNEVLCVIVAMVTAVAWKPTKT